MDSGISEDRLIELLEEKDKYAQELFVIRYYSNMFSIALRYLRNREDVEDVLQDSFISAIKKFDQFKGDSALKTWLTSIVINNCLMLLRSEKKNPEVQVEEYLPKFDSDGFRVEDKTNIEKSPEELMNDKQKKEFIKSAVDKLPGHYRTIIMLRDIEGYSVKETSELLELTEANVKSRLHRARLALKKLLEDYFG